MLICFFFLQRHYCSIKSVDRPRQEHTLFFKSIRSCHSCSNCPRTPPWAYPYPITKVLFRCGNWCYTGEVSFAGLGDAEVITLKDIPRAVPMLQRQQDRLKFFCCANRYSGIRFDMVKKSCATETSTVSSYSYCCCNCCDHYPSR